MSDDFIEKKNKNGLKISKGFTWAEWSIVVAILLIVMSICVIFWAYNTVRLANGRVAHADSRLAEIQEQLEEARNMIGSFSADQASLDRDEEIETLKGQLAGHKKDNDSLKELGKSAGEERERLKGHINQLNAFIDKHENSRWFTLGGRPKRDP